MTIPQGVYDELTSLPDQPGGAEVRSLSWIVTGRANDRDLVTALLSELDSGEAEAIALAVELKADLLLLDERLARRVAAHHGIKVTGTLGVLVEAKHAGHITAVKPLVDDLTHKARFRMRRDLYQAILKLAGES